MPRAIDPRGVSTDRLPSKGMGGPIPDFGQYQDWDNPLGMFIENLLQNIKDVTGIDLFWLLDWSWTTNTMMELIRQANDLMAWLQNPIQRPPNLLARPGFSSPSAIAEAPDWSWDAVVSLGTVTGPDGRPKTDPQGSARTTADGLQHSMLSKSISGSAITPGQILTCQMYALVEAGFTASDDQAIRLELVPSLLGALQDAVVLAHCGVPVDASTDWIAAPVGSKAVFFDVDYEVPKTDTPDTLELRVVVGESAGGNVPVRFDGGRVAAAGGFLVVLSDLFDAGRQYLTDLWAAIEAWLADMSAWAAFTTAADDAWAIFVKKVKRALRHADADSYVPPSTSGIISDALKNNPWFGWLFSMVDDWLEPVLNIGKASADFGDAIWQAVSTFVGDVSAPNAWQTMVSTITTAWDLFIRRVFVSWGATEAQAEAKAQAMPNPATATEAAIKNNPVIGWVFDLDGLVDALTDVAKAAWDSLFGTTNYAGTFTDAWNALMSKLGWAGAPTKTIGEVGSAAATKLLAGIWQPLGDYLTELPLWLDGLNAAFTDFFKAAWDYILGGNRYDDTTRAAWSKPAGAILETAWKNLWAKITGTAASTAPTPGSAGAQGLWNGISSNFIQSALSGWTDSAIHAITDPIGNFFDQVRKYINQMIEGLHLGYFDDSWAWVPSLTTPTTEIPGSGDAVMTPGRNDDDAPGISSQADASIPAAPTGLVAVPWWDLSVSNFPAGTITYAIAAVKGGVEGPATQVKAFAGTLVPPNTNGRVDLAWNAVSGATYKIYRKVDSTYTTAQDWRLIASPSTAGTLLSPYSDKTARTGGTVAHPKTDAELAAQIVTAVKTTATNADGKAVAAQGAAATADSKAVAAATTANNALPQTLWNIAQSGGTNLVFSPDFEDSTVVRPVVLAAGSTAGYSTEQKHGGVQSYKIVTGTTPGSFTGVQLLPTNTLTLLKVQPGQWFYGEIWVYGATTNTGTASPWWRLDLFDSTGVNTSTYLTFQAASTFATFGAWTKLSGLVQIPAGYDTARPMMYVSSTVASQTFYYEDVRVVEETAAQVAQAAAITAAATDATTKAGNAQSAAISAAATDAATKAAAAQAAAISAAATAAQAKADAAQADAIAAAAVTAQAKADAALTAAKADAQAKANAAQSAATSAAATDAADKAADAQAAAISAAATAAQAKADAAQAAAIAAAATTAQAKADAAKADAVAAAATDAQTKANAALAAATDQTNELTDAVRTGADGAAVTGSTSSDVQASVDNLRSKLVDIQTQVENLTTTTRPGGVVLRASPGVAASNWDPFVLSGATAAASKTIQGFGWTPSGNSAREVWGRFPTPVNTDTFTVQVTTATAPAYNTFASSYTDSAQNMLAIRCNTTLTYMVYARIWGNGVRLYGRANGVETLLGSVPMSAANPPGTVWQLFCLGNVYTLTRNDATVLQKTYASIPNTATYRYCAIGAASLPSTFNEWVPGRISGLMTRDAAPVTVSGSGALILGRASGSQTYSTGGTILTLNRDVFNVQPEYQSDDIILSPYATGSGPQMSAQVTVDGWYSVDVGVWMSWTGSGSSIYQTSAALLQTDGGGVNPIWTIGGSLYYPFSGACAAHTFLTYMEAGDVVQPAAQFNVANSMASTATGVGRTTRFGITRVGVFEDAA